MVTNINNLSLDKTYTYADYLQWNFTERLELIKGKIFKMSPAPSLEHQDISGNLFGPMHYYLKKKKCKVFAAPFDVRLVDAKKSKEKETEILTVVQPDICVVCDLDKLDKRGCLGAPNLVVEILSPSTAKKDLNDKYKIYQEHGVKEYWVVFPKDQVVQVFDLDELGQYQLRQNYEKEELLTTPLFPNFELDLKEVFTL